jgi:putative membrane-bound dehydrogenase-like protein
MTGFRVAAAMFVAALTPLLSPAADVAPDTYLVGVAEVDITPTHPIRLNGFGNRRTESEGVNHPIHARALSIRHPGDGLPVLLLTVDVLGIPAHVREELEKRLVVPIDQLAITATHTHCGPMLSGANPTLFGVPIPEDHQKHIDEYTKVFLDKLERVALDAMRDPRPSHLYWGVGTVGFAKNRRTPGGPTDHDLPVLVVRDAKTSAVRAVYATYACHCVTLSHNKLGGDWAGYAAEAIVDKFPGAIGMISVGCGADQNPDSGVTGDKVDTARMQGRQVAEEIARLTKGYLAPVRGKPVCALKSVTLPLAELPDRKGWEEKAKRADAIGYHARVQLAKLDRGERLATSIDYPIQTWQFGDSLAMVHLSGEVVVDYSTRLKTDLDRTRVWLTAYANTNPCYIPSERILKEGGYEGGGAMVYYDVPVPFKPGLEGLIVREVNSQLGSRFACPFDATKVADGKPLSPQQSQKVIRTAGGFAVDLVAAEPLVASPVAIAFGPDGKLWVVEMLDYPSGKTGKFEPGGRVRYLEDTDGDGIFDTATTFLDNLPFPTGVLPWRNGVLICAAPDILFAESTTGTGKADRVTKLYSGFGTENYQARVNSLQYGLDGWVYGSCGLFGGNILSHKTGKSLALGDRDFRIKPDTGEIEPATGRTQQGRVRNDWDDWFGCDSGTLVRHYALADHDLRRNPYVVPPNPAVNVLAGTDPTRLFPASSLQLFALSGPPGRPTAACGIAIYRDDRLGTEFVGNTFTCEPVNLLVTRRVLRPSGPSFQAVRSPQEANDEFLTSTDPWFRPVQAVTGPDGGLWVADMYRFVIEHPRWIPPADLAKLDVRAGAGLGRIYRVRPKEDAPRPWPRLDKLDTPGLVTALDSPNGWQRDTATELLAWRNDKTAVPFLERLARESKRPEARFHALVALDRLNALTASLLRPFVDDPHPGVRRHAVRMSAPFLNARRDLADAVTARAADDDPHVRNQVTVALGSWTDAAAGAALAAVAERAGGNPLLLAPVCSSLTKTNFPAFVGQPFVRDLGRSPLLPMLLATAVGLKDDAVLESMLETLAQRRGSGYEPWQYDAVGTVLDVWRRSSPGREFPKELTAVRAEARTVALDRTADKDRRVGAVKLLGRDPGRLTDDLRDLGALLVPQVPSEIQTAAVGALARTGDDRVVDILLAGWSGYSPGLRQAALSTLLRRDAWVPKLLAAIAAGKIPASAVSPGDRQGLLTSPNATLRSLAEKAFAGAADPDRVKVIDAYRAALPKSGDAIRGRAVFEKTCSTCHRLNGVGHEVGPDLAALVNKSAEYLLAEILDPSRNLDNRYVEYKAYTTDGRTLTGLLAAETAAGITLRQAEGKDVVLIRADLDSLKSTGKSLMPEGLEKDVTPAMMADLITYLLATSTPHKVVPGNQPVPVSGSAGPLILRAADAEIRGGAITFEAEFGNVGMWHGAKDHIAWKVRTEAGGEFDVYLDYACDPGSVGNPLALDGGDPTLRWTVTSTGGWATYKWVKIGTTKLPSGDGKVTVRPDAETVRGALLDLRTVYLVPKGAEPKFPAAKR